MSAKEALRDLLAQLDGIGIPDWHGAEGLDLTAARAAVSEPETDTASLQAAKKLMQPLAKKAGK